MKLLIFDELSKGMVVFLIKKMHILEFSAGIFPYLCNTQQKKFEKKI